MSPPNKDMTLDEVFRLAPIMEDQTEEVPSAATSSATSSATVSARPPPNPAVPTQPRPQSFPQFAPKVDIGTVLIDVDPARTYS